MLNHVQRSPKRQAVAGPKMVIFDFSTLAPISVHSYLGNGCHRCQFVKTFYSGLHILVSFWVTNACTVVLWKALFLLCNIKPPTSIEDDAPWNMHATDLFAFLSNLCWSILSAHPFAISRTCIDTMANPCQLFWCQPRGQSAGVWGWSPQSWLSCCVCV